MNFKTQYIEILEDTLRYIVGYTVKGKLHDKGNTYFPLKNSRLGKNISGH